eukprot:scaffold91540_cov22-Prasinocladus_malaysianus.AAC.1
MVLMEPICQAQSFDIDALVLLRVHQDVSQLEAVISSWRQAKASLRTGMSVEEMVRSELERVYGAGSVVCVNVMANHEVAKIEALLSEAT